uniref:Uncharacterized protein n=1 Tax=Parascaris univalens TaxID=6257 RepID=A0A915A2Y5_PARUN
PLSHRSSVFHALWICFEHRSAARSLTMLYMTVKFLQAIIARAHFCGYGPIIHVLSCSEEIFRTVVQDRYGHRVLLCALWSPLWSEKPLFFLQYSFLFWPQIILHVL